MIVRQIIKTEVYRVKCEAFKHAPTRGCWLFGPCGESKQEAEEIALEEGWKNRNGKWICPGHLKAHGKWWPQWYRDQEKGDNHDSQRNSCGLFTSPRI